MNTTTPPKTRTWSQIQVEVEGLLSKLYPYPLPMPDILKFLNFLRRTWYDQEALDTLEKSTELSNAFRLVGEKRCEPGVCRCICGRPILHVLEVAHSEYDISFGLGRECVKRFFPDLSLAQYRNHKKKLDQLCQQTLKAIETGIDAEHDCFLKALQLKLLSADQAKRLAAGLPLTLTEKVKLDNAIDHYQGTVLKEKQRLVRKVLNRAGYEKRPEAFKHLMGILETGEAIHTLEDLLQYNLEDLAQGMTNFSPTLAPPKTADTQVPYEPLSEEARDRALTVYTMLQFLETRANDLTSVAQERLINLMTIVANSMVQGQGTLTDAACHLLLKRETQQEVINMGNQLGVNLSLPKTLC